MSLVRSIKKMLCVVICAAAYVGLASSPLFAKNKNGVGGGNQKIYYYAVSEALGLDVVESNGTDSKQLVFRNARINLHKFTQCDYGDDTSDKAGTLVLQPKSNRNPVVATLTFWFDAPLSPETNEDIVTHRFYMEGKFGPADWPPSEENYLEFDYWEVAAENPKAQTHDCDDSAGPPVGPYRVDVLHE